MTYKGNGVIGIKGRGSESDNEVGPRRTMFSCRCGEWSMVMDRWYDVDGVGDAGMALNVTMVCNDCGEPIRSWGFKAQDKEIASIISRHLEETGQIEVSLDDKMDLLEHLDLPNGNWFMPEDYDPGRTSCYDFQEEVEKAYQTDASLAGIQGDHFCLIWFKPPEDYTYPSGSENKDEVCYYVQPAWYEPCKDNEWKGEWYLEIHPQEGE